MNDCNFLIKRDIERNCSDPLTKGVEREGIIINRDDIDFGAVKYKEGSANVIEALPLKAGKRGFRIKQASSKPFNGTKSTMEVGTNINTVSHEVAIVILDSGADVASGIVDGLLNGDFVVILENKYKGLQGNDPGSAAFQVYGFHQGAKMASGEADKYSEDTESGWSVVLKEEKAPVSAMYLYAGSYSATKTLIDTLTVEATE